MMWRDLFFAALGALGGFAVGMIMGLSLGFRIGTRRTIILFTKHFPTLNTMNQLVALLFKVANRLTAEEKKTDDSQQKN